MRKMILVLVVVMFTTSAWATVTITATDLGEGKGEVAIEYSSDDAVLVRAFALDISVDAGTITNIDDFKIGDDNNGYGIFLANFSRYIIVDPATGEVSDWAVTGYTPVADGNDPGALGGLGTSGITIEMGSLYVNNAPAKQGRLCTVTCSETCKLSVTPNATRGNVVLEDATEANLDLTGATDVQVTVAQVDQQDAQIATDSTAARINPIYTGPHPDQWEAVGKPNCWCANINPRQCRGDADGASQGNQYWVYTNDLDILVAAWNKPLELLSGNQICADFDHQPEGERGYRVSNKDIEILLANWKVANGPAHDCP